MTVKQCLTMILDMRWPRCSTQGTNQSYAPRAFPNSAGALQLVRRNCRRSRKADRHRQIFSRLGKTHLNLDSDEALLFGLHQTEELIRANEELQWLVSEPLDLAVWVEGVQSLLALRRGICSTGRAAQKTSGTTPHPKHEQCVILVPRDAEARQSIRDIEA